MAESKYKKGGVSIFVVIFTTILLGVIALGFIRLMILDQQRAINSDLANSALDSAMAGVADAKRAIIKYEREICAGNNSDCNSYLQNFLNGKSCDAASKILYNQEGQETPIATSEGNDLAQAYTCAKIKYFTDDYVRDFKDDDGEQMIIPLNFTHNVTSLDLRWHTQEDLIANNQSSYNLFGGDKTQWPTQADWGNNPPVLMVQLIQVGDNGAPIYNDAPILFLKPHASNNDVVDFRLDHPQGRIRLIKCNPSSRPYQCSAKLEFSEIAAGNRNAFLRVAKIYGGKTTVEFRPTSADANSPIRFNGVQPEIDVTGRANYIFRRLKARVEFTGGLFPYPTAALKTNGDICKSFEVTDEHLKGDKSFSKDDELEKEITDSDFECLID